MSLLNRILGQPDPEYAYQKGDSEALERILALQGEKFAGQRALAASYLGILGDRSAGEALSTVLEDPSPQVRAAAAGALGKLEESRFIPQLEEVLLNDKDLAVQRSACNALAGFGAPAIEPLAMALSRHGKADLLTDCIQQALLGINASPVLSILTNNSDENGDLLDPAGSCLERLGNSALPEFSHAMHNSKRSVRLAAAKQLACMGDPGQQVLFDLLHEADCMVQEASIIGLGLSDSDEAATRLEMLPDHKRDDLRLARITALTRLRRRSSRTILFSALQDPESKVVAAAAQGIQALGWESETDQEKVYLYAALGKWKEALQAGDPAIKLLDSALHSSDPVVRKQAQAGLENYVAAGGRPSSLLISLLTDQEPELRTVAARLIGKTRDPGMLNPIKRATRDVSPEVRQAATITLEKLPDPQKIGQFIVKLKNPDPNARIEAISCLARMGDKRAIEPLLRLLNDPYKVKENSRTTRLRSSTHRMDEIVTHDLFNYPVRQAAAEVLRTISRRLIDPTQKREIDVKVRQAQLSHEESTSDYEWYPSDPDCYCDAH